MEILYLLEKIRIPVLNEFMLLITRLGEETAFLVIALILFWCVDKQRGYYVLSVGFLGTIFSQFLKITCRIPRPWVLDENFTILEQAREAATGYSFPSGHTQTAFGVFGSIARTEKNKCLRRLFVILAVLVGFSRMYIGVHTPADVIVGAAISVALLFALYPLIMKSTKHFPLVIGIMTVIAVVYLAYVELYPFPADIDAHNLESAFKNAYTLLGCMIGMNVVYFLDTKYLQFSVQAPWWVQVLKVVGGLAVVLAVKEGLRSPLEALFTDILVARAVRYFLIVVVAGSVWPLTFPHFRKLAKMNTCKSCKEEDHE